MLTGKVDSRTEQSKLLVDTLILGGVRMADEVRPGRHPL